MRRWLRRAKAAATLGGLWGAASAVAATAVHFVLQLSWGGLSWEPLLQSALQYGLTGWVVGTAFAGALIDFEERGLLGRMAPWRVAIWGAVMGGGLAPLVALLTGGSALLHGLSVPGFLGVGAVVGAALSIGTLRLAESVSRELAEVGSGELLGAGEDGGAG